MIIYVVCSCFCVEFYVQSSLLADPHPVTEEYLMCIGLSLFEVGHFDETGSHYSLVPLCYINYEWLFTPNKRRNSSTF